MTIKRFSADDYELVQATTLPNGEVEYAKAVSVINPVTGEPATTVSGAMLIGNAKNKWRYEATTWGGATDEYFELVQAGSNQVVSVLGDTGGSRYLNISSGIDAGSETILLSRETFTPPFTFTYAITLSQRIINCEAHMEMVEVDDTGAVVTDTSIALAPAFKNARSGLGMVYSGTSTTAIALKVRSNGISENVFGAVSYGTGNATATGTAPNLFPSYLVDVSFNADRVSSSSRSVNQ